MTSHDDPTAFADDLRSLMEYLDEAVSPRHAVMKGVEILQQAGFERVVSLEAEPPIRGFVAVGGLLVAWVRGDDSMFRLVGAHTDSPCLRVKPHPDLIREGWRQWAVEVYGGILNNSWLDRDLGFAGIVVDRAGVEHLVRSPSAVARVPQLAVHLDRDVNDKGLVLDRQQHLTPVVGLDVNGRTFDAVVSEWAGVAPGSIVSYELSSFDVQPAALIGVDHDLLASGRIDNQLSCWAALSALSAIGASPSSERPTAVVALFDHEEVGSESTTGASGPWLEWVLARLHGRIGPTLHDALASSACLSVDCAHGVHPNYPDRHDPTNRPLIGGGPVLKVNANQRYATSPETAALFARSCESAGVPWQTFVSRNNLPCGSTIGPLASTRLGVPTVDVGVAQLSMHSAREMCGTKDPTYLRRAIESFFARPQR